VFETTDASCGRYAADWSWATTSGVGIPTASNLPRAETLLNQDAGHQPGVRIPTLPLEPTFWLCPDCLDFHVTVEKPELCTRCGYTSNWQIVPESIWRDPQALKHWWQQRYRDHQQAKNQHISASLDQPKAIVTSEDKLLIEKVRAQIPNLSLANARKVVQEFGAHLIEKALQAVRTRSNLRSPAGFLIAFLKSEQKILSNNNNSVHPIENRESSITWVKRMAKSKYLSFIANADDILDITLGDTNDPLPA